METAFIYQIEVIDSEGVATIYRCIGRGGRRMADCRPVVSNVHLN